VAEDVHSGDQRTGDVDPEIPHDVNLLVHWTGSWDMVSRHVDHKDLETGHVFSLVTWKRGPGD